MEWKWLSGVWDDVGGVCGSGAIAGSPHIKFELNALSACYRTPPLPRNIVVGRLIRVLWLLNGVEMAQGGAK